MNIEQKLKYSSFNIKLFADLEEYFDFAKMFINSKHDMVLRFRPSFAVGMNQLSVAAGFTSNNSNTR